MKNKIIILMILILLSINISGIGNPAAVYCEEMGYEFVVEKIGLEEKGLCVVNGYEFDAWDFFRGEVGKEYSYCSKNGYNLEIIGDGNDSFSKDYAVCVPKQNPSVQISSSAGASNKIKMADLMGLEDKIVENIKINPFPEQMVSSTFQPDFNLASLDPFDPIPEIKASAPAPSQLPSYFDWRDKDGQNWMTPVKNQGSCGACWAFAAVGTVEAQKKIDANINQDLSEQEIISCASGVDCNGGFTESAFNYIRDSGVVSESDFPYISSNGVCSIPNAQKTFIDSWENIDNSYWMGYNHEEQEEIVKKALIEKGPVAVNIYMDGTWQEGIYKCEPIYDQYHAVVITGYNYTGNISTSYWIAKNSWGNTWNNNGYFKVGWDGYYPGWGNYSQCGILFQVPKYVIQNLECENNQTRNCTLQQGVCAGAIETCGDNTWQGCDYGSDYKEENCSCGVSTECKNKSIELIGVERAWMGVRDVIVKDGYAYLGGACLQVMNISDIKSPFVVGSICSGRPHYSIDLQGDYIYATDDSHGMKIYDISNPTNIQRVAPFDDDSTNGFRDTVLGIDVVDNYVYLANNDMGLKIIDVSDPFNPFKVGEYYDGTEPFMGGYAYGVHVVGDIAYVADLWKGVDIINVSDKTNPVKLGGIDLSGDAFEIQVVGDYAYVGTHGQGLVILDVSDPTNPFTVGTFDTGGYANEGFADNLYVLGDYAYVASWKQGLFIIDISDPTNPTEVLHYYDGGGLIEGVYADENYVYAGKNNWEYNYDNVGLFIFNKTGFNCVINECNDGLDNNCDGIIDWMCIGASQSVLSEFEGNSLDFVEDILNEPLTQNPIQETEQPKQNTDSNSKKSSNKKSRKIKAVVDLKLNDDSNKKEYINLNSIIKINSPENSKKTATENIVFEMQKLWIMIKNNITTLLR